jgi:hypothetical protein
VSKAKNRQARRSRKASKDAHRRRNLYIRSALSLVTAVVLSAVFYRLGVLHRLEPAFDQLESRLEPSKGTSDVALVVIDDEDYQKLFQSQSPLAPETLQYLINAIALGRPKVIGVDIDTSDLQFKSLEIPEWWPPLVWQRSVQDYPGSNIQTEKPQAVNILGGRDPSLNANSGLALLIDTEGNVTRRYQREIDTTSGILPSFPWAIISKFNSIKTKNLRPSTEELVIRYSGGANRFRFSASRLLELYKGGGWTGHSPIEGRIVLLGGSYGVGDRHETPLGTMTGVEVLSNVIETELSGGGHHPPNTLVIILLLSFEGFGTVFIFHRLKFSKALAWSVPGMILLSAACSLLAYGSLTQLPYFLLLLVALIVYQGFEAFRHRAILEASEVAKELD